MYQKFDGKFWRYTWDFENRLSVASDRKSTVTYQYDALWRRVLRLARGQGGVTKFTYQGADVVLEDNNGTQTKYLNGLGVDNKLRVQTGNDVKYFLSDHLGSTTALTDATGSVTASNSYDSFGNATNSAFPSRCQFTGREYDSFTGLTNYRARWLDSKLGRFISADPIGLSGGTNQFTYVGNNPINAKDPSGLYEVDVHYWLTRFLASKNTCYSPEVADQIAASDQDVDTNPATAPGFDKIEQNINFHALTPYSYEGKRNWVLWANALSGGGSELGIHLHYLQDTFSHAGYSNSIMGHAWLRDDALAGSDVGYGADLDAADKTYKDVPKTLRMAFATWSSLNEYAQKRCHCSGPAWNNAWFDQIKRFAEVKVGSFPKNRIGSIEGELPLGLPRMSTFADPEALQRKIDILFPR